MWKYDRHPMRAFITHKAAHKIKNTHVGLCNTVKNSKTTQYAKL